MEKMLKLAGLAVASLGAVASASAASYEPAGCNCEITIPKYAGGFEFSLELFKVKANEAGTNYAFSNNNLVGSNLAVTVPAGIDNQFDMHSVDSGYAFGYGVDFGYRLAGTGNDIHVVWSHYDESESDTTRPVSPATVDALGLVVTPGLTITSAKGRVKHDVDVVDLEYGQRFNVGSNWEVRTHAGFRYASIERDFTRSYEFAASTLTGNSATATKASEANESEFRGVGPRFGTSVHFPMANGFGVKAELASAVLVGNVSEKFTFSDNATTNNAFTIKGKDHKVIAPTVDAAVSLDYTYNFSNDNSLMFEVGYRMQNFFNTVHQDVTNLQPVLNDANVEDYGQHGAFLRAVLVV